MDNGDIFDRQLTPELFSRNNDIPLFGIFAMDQPDGTGVVNKTLNVLELLLVRPDATVSEISEGTGITKAAAYRILSALERRGYVATYEKVRRYSIGPAFYSYERAARAADRLLVVSRPIMEEIWASSGETVNLGVLIHGGVQYLDIIESPQGLRATGTVGATDTLHSTALGKAIMTRMSAAQRDECLTRAGLVPRTSNTETDLAALRGSIDLAAREGCAVDNEENEIGMRCVAVPIVNADGWPLAAMSVSGPSSRMTDDVLNRIGIDLIDASRRISEELARFRGEPGT